MLLFFLYLVKSKVLFYSILRPVKKCHLLTHLNEWAVQFHEQISPILISTHTINSSTHYTVTVASVWAGLVMRNVWEWTSFGCHPIVFSCWLAYGSYSFIFVPFHDTNYSRNILIHHIKAYLWETKSQALGKKSDSISSNLYYISFICYQFFVIILYTTDINHVKWIFLRF